MSPQVTKGHLFLVWLVLFVLILGAYVTAFVAHAPFTPAADECTVSNSLCGPIHFITSVFGNSSLTQTVATSSWNAVQNETMIVVAQSPVEVFASQVSSITDTFNDVFTRSIQQFNVPGQGNMFDLEIWIGQASAGGQNLVTTNWNQSAVVITQVLVYTGVAGIGNKTSYALTTAPAGGNPQTLTTTKSGSWLLGVTDEVVVPQCTGNYGVAGTLGIVVRADQCVFESPGSIAGESEVSDNATALRNTLTLTYQRTTQGTSIALFGAFMELTPSDLEPKQPNFNTFCTQSTPLCFPNWVNKVSGISTAQNIVVGTAYCTGITTSALSLSSSTNVELWATYAGQSRNDTGATIIVEFETSTGVPSTSFGVGQCASGNQIWSTAKLYFASSGVTLTGFGLNEYAVAINGVALGSTTIYGWIEIIPQSVGVGNLGSTIQYAQWGANQHSSISMLAIK